MNITGSQLSILTVLIILFCYDQSEVLNDYNRNRIEGSKFVEFRVTVRVVLGPNFYIGN